MGGLSGRMKHLYELDTTVDDITSHLFKIIDGSYPVQEKLDGQSISMTFVNKEIRFARNKTEKQKGGLTVNQIREKFKGHPAEKSFVGGCEAIDECWKNIRDINKKITNKAEHDLNWKFIDAELICKDHRNIIQYDLNMFSFHHKPPRHYQDPFVYLFSVELVTSSNLESPWAYYLNEYQCIKMPLLDKILADSICYSILNKFGKGPLRKIVEKRLQKDLQTTNVGLYLDYIYGYNEFTARELLKMNPRFSIASSREKARVYLRDTLLPLHEMTQSCAEILINNMKTIASHEQKYNIKSEGFVLDFENYGKAKMTGLFEKINKMHSPCNNNGIY